MVGQPRILIVEDEGVEARDLQRRLVRLGYPQPDIAMSGEEAVRVALTSHPDLILLDIRLGEEMDGVSVAERVRRAFDVPVVYLTADADEETLRSAKITEPFGYIVKPFGEREVHLAIDMALYRHRAEQRLRQGERFLAAILGSLEEAVVTTDGAGRVAFMNHAAEELTEWRNGEAVGRALHEVVHLLAAHSRSEIDLCSTLLGRGDVPGLLPEAVLVDRTGRETQVQATVAPIKGARENDPDPSGFSLVVRNLAQVSHLKRALRESNSQLARASRVRESLLLSMSHELRTPLTAIIGYAGVLLMKLAGPLNEEQERHLRVVTDNAEHLLVLVGDLLDLASVESGRLDVCPAELSCRKVLEEATAGALQEADRKGITIEVSAVEGDPRVVGDLVIVDRILRLLVRDAGSASVGGTVRLAVQAVPDGVRFTVCGLDGEPVPDGVPAAEWLASLDDEHATLYDDHRRGIYLSQRLAAIIDGRIELVPGPEGRPAFALVLTASPSAT